MQILLEKSFKLSGSFFRRYPTPVFKIEYRLQLVRPVNFNISQMIERKPVEKAIVPAEDGFPDFLVPLKFNLEFGPPAKLLDVGLMLIPSDQWHQQGGLQR